VGFGFVGLHHRADGSSPSIRPGCRTLVPAVSRQRNAPCPESGRARAGRGRLGQLPTRALESNLRRHQLGKLRAFGAATGVDLGESLRFGGIGPGGFHRGSPPYLVRLWCGGVWCRATSCSATRPDDVGVCRLPYRSVEVRT